MKAHSGLAPFVAKRRGVLHCELDRARLGRSFRHMPPQGSLLDGAFDAWSWEAIRAKWQLEPRKPLPTDVFVWARGEAPDRRFTKIGGVPFLPRGTAWPLFRGQPMTFLAQFAFHDSRDLVGKLPGDLLLVFAADEDALIYENRLVSLWVRDRRRPIDPSACPLPAWRFFRGWGVRHRTWDAPELFERAYGVSDVLEQYDKPRAWSEYVWRAPVLQATKIGGAPWDAQTNYPEAPRGRRFLCQLSTMHVSNREPWPCVNIRRKPAGTRSSAEDSLSIGDDGAIAFWIDRRGRVRVHESCA